MNNPPLHDSTIKAMKRLLESHENGNPPNLYLICLVAGHLGAYIELRDEEGYRA